MANRLLKLLSVVRDNLFSTQIRHSSKFNASSRNFLLRRVSTASVAQQISPSSTNSPPKDASEKKQSKPISNAEPVTVTFITTDGTRHTVKGREGDSLLDVVIDKQIPLDGYGACEGTLACSTCHVVLHKKDYDRLPDKPSDEELDMLDLAYGLTDTSRLGCQIILKKEYEGLEVMVPAGVHDARNE